MNSHQALLQAIEDNPELPVLPPGTSTLLKTLTNDDICYSELAIELEKHPSIAIKIVSAANSAWASPISPITSLRDSCSRIGVPLVRSIAIALSMSDVFNPSRCPSFNPKLFWTSSLLTAEAAFIVAKDTTDISEDTARLAGLLHNIGLLWLADKRPNETSDAIILSQNNEYDSLSKVLTEKHNLDLYTVGGWIATALELPEITTASIASCSTNYENTGEDEALVNLHQHACSLATIVLSNTEPENIEEINSDISQHIKHLQEKLPLIQSMAETLFSK